MTVTFIEGIRISKGQLTHTVTEPVQDTESPSLVHHSDQRCRTKTDAAVDNLVLLEYAFGTLAGVIASTSAVLTTVVESLGFWRYFWLTVCIVSFVCATCLIIQGTRNFYTKRK